MLAAYQQSFKPAQQMDKPERSVRLGLGPGLMLGIIRLAIMARVRLGRRVGQGYIR